MNRKTVAAMLFVLLSLVCFGTYRVIMHFVDARRAAAAAQQQKQAQEEATRGGSDAKVNTTIRIGGDDYLGYFFTVSPEMKRQAARRALGIDYTNDGGDYADRLKKFNDGQYDCIVLPINSYLQHGLKYNYPGVITASIAESRGADAILAFKNKLPTGKVTDLNDASLKFVYTGESPSSFLNDLTIVDFDLFYLQKTDRWRSEAKSSQEVLERAKQHDGDVFTLWEPQVSQALKDVPGLTVVWASDRFHGYIVDVFVFKRDFLKNHNDDVVSFFEAYFSTMRSYKADRARLVEDIRQNPFPKAPDQTVVTHLDSDQIEGMLKKIDWYDLQSNCSRQFGLDTGAGETPTEGVLNTILSCTNVLVKTGKLQKDPLSDPYIIINSSKKGVSILDQVRTKLPADIGSKAGSRQFRVLTVDEWKDLPEIGAMRVEPITFQSGSAQLDAEGQQQVDKIAELLWRNYPDTRVIIRGHTSPGNDEEDNVRLSKERSDAVMQVLTGQHGMSPNRFRSEGKGSSQPPPRRAGRKPSGIDVSNSARGVRPFPGQRLLK